MKMTTNNIFLTSDTHFTHANIIRYFCVRPFASVEEMNETLIERWNSVVRHNDHVYHLGDVYFKKEGIEDILKRLNGKKRLVIGNHDELKDGVLTRFFEKVMVSRYFKDEKLFLTHIPVQVDSILGGPDVKNVHGHIHEKLIESDRYVNICVEHTNYKPVPIEEVYGHVSYRVREKADEAQKAGVI